MDVIFQYPKNSKSFFVPSETRDIGGGVELWRGYFQSVRPAVNRMLINVDIAAAMMYRSGPLLDVCLSFFETQDPNLLAPRHGLTPSRHRALARFLLNLPVRTVHNNRNRMIRGVSEAGAQDSTFDFNGRTINVATYFRVQANTTLQWPDVVCVKVSPRSSCLALFSACSLVFLCLQVGTGALVPLELCIVSSGNFMRNELSQEKAREMVEFSRIRPADRLHGICNGFNVIFSSRS